jgi:transketolase
MNSQEKIEKQIFAAKIRIEILKELSEIGSGHVGGSLDLADLLAVLYSGKMRINPKDPTWKDRDYIVISKGHAGPALYATLALCGYFPMEVLKTLNQPGTMLPSHCDHNKTPGVDVTAGSLGQGIGVAVGIALGHKIQKRNNYVYCIIGDGEMQEGSVWEALLLAPQFQLNNLLIIVDDNGLQIDGSTKQIDDLGDISKKVSEFGWYVIDVDGSDVEAIDSAITCCKLSGSPSFINLHTVKGKGWPTYEGKVASHYVKGITKECVVQPISHLEKLMENLEKQD